MSTADDREGLNAIEREPVDGDPAPPWVPAAFVTAAVSWTAPPGLGVLVGAVALAWVLLDTTDGEQRPPGPRSPDGRVTTAARPSAPTWAGVVVR